MKESSKNSGSAPFATEKSDRPLLFFADVHLSKKKVKSRRDDPYEATAKKLEWIANRARELDARVYCGGDVTDYWNWTPEDAFDAARLWDCFDRRVYCAVGNHDVVGGSLGMLPFSGLGMMAADKSCPLVVVPGGVAPFGPGWADIVTAHWGDLEKVLRDLAECPDESRRFYVFAHASVSDTEGPDGAWQSFDSLDIPSNVKGFACGDIHKPAGPVLHRNGTTVCVSPGAVSRRNISEAWNTPQIAVFYPDGSVVVEDIPCAPAEEVFLFEQHEKTKAEKAQRLSFAAAYQEAADAKLSDPRELVLQVAEETKPKERWVQLVLEELAP